MATGTSCRSALPGFCSLPFKAVAMGLPKNLRTLHPEKNRRMSPRLCLYILQPLPPASILPLPQHHRLHSPQRKPPLRHWGEVGEPVAADGENLARRVQKFGGRTAALFQSRITGRSNGREMVTQKEETPEKTEEKNDVIIKRATHVALIHALAHIIIMGGWGDVKEVNLGKNYWDDLYTSGFNWILKKNESVTVIRF